jgi:ribosomal protein S18 acetylase RimI-like enzyme
MKTATIREYKENDYEKLREVCFRTATGAYTKNKEITAALFVEYYIEHESEHCFVVADKDDNAVGYIICAPDYSEFVKKFIKYKQPKIRKLSLKEAIIRRLEFMYMKRIGNKYPAHLHIDILDDYQRMGLGHKLINKLMRHLNEIGVSRLHLGCSAQNIKGVNFYNKIGFHKVRKIAGAVIFGIDIAEYVSKLDEKEKNVQ